MATFYNRASLSYGGTTTNSNIVEGQLIEVVSASKTVLSSSYASGENIVYAINIVNSGATDVNGVSVTDNLGSYMFVTEAGTEISLTPLTYLDGSVKVYLNGTLSNITPTVSAGPPLVFSNLSVPANSNISIIYEATVNGFAPLGAGDTITNTAIVAGDGIAEPLTLTATVDTGVAPALTIAKAICPATVTDNGQLTYTFIIQNSGNEEVVGTGDLVLTDTFSPILNPISVTLNGAPLAEGTGYTYDETTGEFATLPGQLTVPAATYTQDGTTGAITVSPGVTVLTVTGTV